MLRDHGVPPERVRFCATSATRDASNAAVFAEGVRRRLGIEPEVLSGDEEAALVYAGAIAAQVRDCRPSRCSSSTSAAGRPSWCWGRAATGRRCRWTSGPSASTSATSTPTRRRAEEVAACVADIDRHLDDVRDPARPRPHGRRHLRHDQDDRVRRPGPGLLRPRGLRPGRAAQRRHRVLRRRPARADGRGAARAALHAPRSCRRHRRGRPDLEPHPRPGAGDRRTSSPRPTSCTAWPPRSPDERPGPPPAPGRGQAPSPARCPRHRLARRPGGRGHPGRARRRRRTTTRAPTCRWPSSTPGSASARRAPGWWRWREDVAVEKRASFADQPYWGRPIAGWGDPEPSLLIVGLAPAANGGNRTGRIFTGDPSADWLFASLHRTGWAAQATSQHAGDGQRLVDARMVATVRCAPPENKPTAVERDTCAPWIAAESGCCCRRCGSSSRSARSAGTAPLRSLVAAGAPAPSTRPKFGHGAEVAPGRRHAARLLPPQPHNTYTGRLTREMTGRRLRAGAADAGADRMAR